MLELTDGRKGLWQWDTGVTATVLVDCDEVHFSNLEFGKSYNVPVENDIVKIPDELLQSGADLFCWAFVGDLGNGYTKFGETFSVKKRAKPSNYVFTPTDQVTINTIMEMIGDLSDLDTEDKKDIVSATNEVLSKKVDKVTPLAGKEYTVAAVDKNGTATSLAADIGTYGGAIPLRDYYGRLRVGTTATMEDHHAASVGYLGKRLEDYVKKIDVDELVGDIETALDNIIAMQNSLIGGGVE